MRPLYYDKTQNMSVHVWNVSLKWTLESSINRTATCPCCPQLFVYVSVWDYIQVHVCYLLPKLKKWYLGNP